MQDKRKLILNIGLGVVLVVVAYFVSNYMIESNKRPDRPPQKIVKTVFTEPVKNGTIPIVIRANGNLVAKNRIDLFSEVQGVLQPSVKEFKPGTTYRKGEVILKMNSEEHYANLQAQKSALYNSITSIMPDIRLDYPEEYEKWQDYLERFDFEKATPPLPETSSDKEKFFVSGRNIYTTYYNLRNMEVRLTKYVIRAPYDGVLTEATVNPGALVRQGQKLGAFISTKSYEMEVAVNAKFMDLLEIGNKVDVFDRDQERSWQGTIIRVNGRVDQTSQTVKAYIQLNDPQLKAGMYLEAHLVAKSEENAFEMERKLLVNNESVYVLQDSIIDLVKVNPVYFNDKTVVVKGLENGTNVLSKSVPGAYPGMVVKQFEGQSNPRQ